MNLRNLMSTEERERQLEEALDECFERGVSTEMLQILISETGTKRWRPKLVVETL